MLKMSSFSFLVTGCTGFIGSHLVERLSSLGHSVHCIIRPDSNLIRISNVSKNLNLHTCVNEYDLERLFDNFKFDYIFHLATEYHKYDDFSRFSSMIDSNIKFPSLLISLAAKNDVKGFINTGSFFEYSPSPSAIDENSLLAPNNFYSRTKICFESILKTFIDSLPIATLKIFYPYGPRDNFKLIPLLFDSILNNRAISLSQGNQRIDPIFIDDIIDSYICCIDWLSTPTNKYSYHSFNIGSGKPFSIREIVEQVELISSSNLNVEWGDPSKVDVGDYYADISKATSILGWTPKFSLHEGLSRYFSEYKELS